MTTKPFRTLDDIVYAKKRVLVRADLNVPMDGDTVADTTRLTCLISTLQRLRAGQAKIIVLSHFGRPKGTVDPQYSLRPVTEALSRCAGFPVAFCPVWRGEEAEKAVDSLDAGDVLVLENTRFDPGEERNDMDLARDWAKLADIFVNDAFPAAHRAHASTTAIATLLPAVAGLQMEAELAGLAACLEHPQRPLMAVVGGSKVSTKIDILTNLVQHVNILVPAGGMANTFLAAMGKNVGGSLYEPTMLDVARTIVDQAVKQSCQIILPEDVVVAKELVANAPHRTTPVGEIAADEKIFDIGSKTLSALDTLLATCATVVWNGPLGVFEVPPFDKGTTGFAQALAKHTHDGTVMSVAGGGDTIAALAHAGMTERLSYVSTAGGAFLEWMEGRALPGVEVLRQVAP